jgi:hypothetical protein
MQSSRLFRSYTAALFVLSAVTAFAVETNPATAQSPKSAEAVTGAPALPAPAVLPGKGIAQHPFLYAGEWDTRKPLEQSMFIVRDGKVVWQFTMPLKNVAGGIQEFDDATLLANGNIIYSHMSGASEVTPDKKVIWNYQAPPKTEVHSVQSLGHNRVLIMRNGNPAQAMIINTATGESEPSRSYAMFNTASLPFSRKKSGPRNFRGPRVAFGVQPGADFRSLFEGNIVYIERIKVGRIYADREIKRS